MLFIGANIYVLVNLAVVINGQYYQTKPEEVIKAPMKFDQIVANLTSAWSNIIQPAFPHMVRAGSEIDMSPECSAAMLKSFLALRQLKGWAIRLVDSTGKPTDGLWEGTLSFIGAYDECLDTVATEGEGEDEKELFRGQYCVAQIAPKWEVTSVFDSLDEAYEKLRPFMPITHTLKSTLRIPTYHVSFRLGLCVPSKCSKDDITKMVKHGVKKYDLRSDVTECNIKEPVVVTPTQLGIILGFAFVFAFCFIGTMIDIWYRYTKPSLNIDTKPKQPKDHKGLISILTTFSMVENGQKLLQVDKRPESLSAVHGIRFISMAWIIFGHTYFFVENVQPARSLFNGHEMYTNNFFMAGLLNFTLSVESFFMLSGLLIVSTHWREMERYGSLHISRFLFNKYWRMMPHVLLVLGLLFLSPLFGNGPFWNDVVGLQVRLCEYKWWSNLLLINNFWNSRQMCMVATWYLACSYQLMVISVFMIIPLFKWPRFGIYFTWSLILAGGIISGVITYIENLPPGLIFYPDLTMIMRLVTYVYHKPYNHIGPFGVGMLVGYAIIKYRNVKITPITQAILWILSAVTSFVVLWSAYSFNNELPDPLLGAVYAATHRTAWCLCLGWLIYACVTERGGVINTFLSWHPFCVLGNLAFLAYMIHPLLILYNVGRTRSLIYYSQYEKIYNFCGHFLVTMVLSAFFYLTIEAPFVELGKKMLNWQWFRLQKTTIPATTTHIAPVVFSKPWHPAELPEPASEPIKTGTASITANVTRSASVFFKQKKNVLHRLCDTGAYDLDKASRL